MKTAEIRPNVQMTHIKNKNNVVVVIKQMLRPKTFTENKNIIFFTGSLNSLSLTNVGLF